MMRASLQSGRDEESWSDCAAFWRGEASTLESAYRAHVRSLLNVARSLVGSAEAESVVQEVFVELLRNEELRRRYTGGSMAAWLTAITRHKGLEHLRRTGRTPLLPCEPSERSDAPPEPRLEARDCLARFLARCVTTEQAPFFRRRFIDGRTQVEIAAELGIARSTLEGWEHRLTEKLRRFILESSR